jgi:hypothetical protein
MLDLTGEVQFPVSEGKTHYVNQSKVITNKSFAENNDIQLHNAR